MKPGGFPLRRTLAASVTVRGIGIHTGASTCVTLAPAETPGAGVLFRVRGTGTQEIPARASNVQGSARCTVLSRPDGASVATVEHLLSALAGLGVTDCLVEVDGPELPIGDGSALVWVDALARAGLKELGGPDGSAPLALEGPVLLSGKEGAFIAAFPSGTLRLTVAISFDHALVGTQVVRFEPARGDDYATGFAPARTFCFFEELEALRATGLARGGSLDNALVVYEDRYSAPLRFPDEFARHKLLDLLGDLALVGSALLMDIVAVKPGHRLNTEFARLLEARTGVPSGSPVP